MYCLNEDGQWDDRGTGHAAVQYMPVSSPADRPPSPAFLRHSWSSARDSRSQRACVRPWPWARCQRLQPELIAPWRVSGRGGCLHRVLSERTARATCCRPSARGGHLSAAGWAATQHTHLSAACPRRPPPRSRYLAERAPELCADTIVSWNEPETGVDYALAQDPDGCRAGSRSAGGVPADGPSREAESGDGRVAQRHDAARCAAAAAGRGDAQSAASPSCSWRCRFSAAKLIEAVLQQDYVLQLVTLFNTVEDLENVPDLHHLFHIFKGLVLLNDTGVYEELLREDLIVSVIGALEYDPELSCHSVNHRAFLKEKVKFNQVVPITDAPTVRKIHQNFHVSFIKDVVLPRALDDHTFAALNQIAFLNNVQIVSHLCNDADYLKRVCEKIGDGELNFEERHDSLRLLQARPSIGPSPPRGRACSASTWFPGPRPRPR